MIVKSCQLRLVAGNASEFPRDACPQVAFMGASNVGKSSLINRLLGVRALARTSKTPGRTRAIHFYLVNGRTYFVDLPGYGYARVPDWMRREWKGLVESYLGGPRRPVLSLLLVDARREPAEHDLQLAEWLRAFSLPHLVAMTKSDKIARGRVGPALAGAARRLGLQSEGLVATSAATGDGVPALWKAIDAACGASSTTAPAVPHPPPPGRDGVHDRHDGAAPGARTPRARRTSSRTMTEPPQRRRIRL